MNVEEFVTFHPGMRSGRPTVGGTRITVQRVVEEAWCDGAEAAARAFDISERAVLIACWFAGLHGDWRQRRQFGKWARACDKKMWAGLWDDLPELPGETT